MNHFETEAYLRRRTIGLCAEIDELKQVNADLIKALEKFMGWLETGMLVRDITKDAKPDWAMKMMHFVKDLGEIQVLIAKARRK